MSEPDNSAKQIQRELAALGEDAPSEAELALADEEAGAALERAPELARVARLIELAEPHEFDDLSELETHRGWRSVEQRLAASVVGEDSRTGAAVPAGTPSSAGGARRWLLAAIGLAAAAAVLVVVVSTSGHQDELAQRDEQAPSATKLSEMADQARAALQALDDGKSDSERAAELARQYTQRMQGAGG